MEKITLVRTKAEGVYGVSGHPHLQVMRHTGRSWSASHGSYTWTKWVATDKSRKDETSALVMTLSGLGKPSLELASASTQAGLRTKLAKLL